jgi:hypothetical protein
MHLDLMHLRLIRFDARSPNQYGITPLMLACQRSFIDGVYRLLEKPLQHQLQETETTSYSPSPVSSSPTQSSSSTSSSSNSVLATESSNSSIFDLGPIVDIFAVDPQYEVTLIVNVETIHATCNVLLSHG